MTVVEPQAPQTESGSIRVRRTRERIGHRLNRASETVERRTGSPAKYLLPAELVGLGLLIAVFGMYWDVAWHIDLGRDETVFTLPHSMIVVGIGICVTGAWLATVLPGPASRGSLRIGRYSMPVGALVLFVCGSVALMAFPLDDVWHRLFGEDVTLWGPTHILMIGGASLCALGIIVLSSEGTAVRATPEHGRPPKIVRLRQYLGCGGLLVALSTLQAEFDFGVPQFQMLFQPVMIAIAAALALTFARATLGRFGAIGAVLGFYAIRGGLALVVGVGFGHTVPHFPLYMGTAICIELLALIRWRNGLAFGAAAGLAAGSVGLASEWGWTKVFMPYDWTASLLPEAAILSLVAGVAAGLLGARIAAAVSAHELAPIARGRATTALIAGAALALLVSLAIPLPRNAERSVRATIVPFDVSADSARLKIDFSKPGYSQDAERFDVLAWQGGSSKHVGLRQVSPTAYETAGRVPYGGNWKSMLRVAHGSKLVAAPVSLPAEPLTDRPALPLTRRTVPLERDTSLLMREAKQDVGGLATPGYALVALIATGWLAALAFALSRAEGGGGGGRSGGSPIPGSRRARLQH